MSLTLVFLRLCVYEEESGKKNQRNRKDKIKKILFKVDTQNVTD